jgi:hypothetical protein
MSLRKLQIIDSKNNVDSLFLLFYTLILGGVIGFELIHSAILFLIALAVSGLIVIRDEILRPKRTPLDDVNEKLTDLQSEITAVRIAQGLSRD